MNKPLFNDDVTDDTRPIAAVTPTTHTRNQTVFRVMIWLLVLFLLLVFGVMVSIITSQPEVIGLVTKQDLNQTYSALDSTSAALQTTEQHHQAQAIALQNTQASLNNWASRLAQTETQTAHNAASTQNALALANAQQATNAAVNFASTQAALQLVSTQIQLDFEMTQGAIANSFATLAAENEANRPAQHVAYINGSFRRGVETTNLNHFPPSMVWAVSDAGMLISQADNATVLTQQTDFGANFTYYAGIKPLATPAHYDVLIGILAGQGGYTLRLYHDGAQIIRAALFPLTPNQWQLDYPIIINEAQPEQAAMNSTPLVSIAAEDIYIEIQVNEGQHITIITNGVQLFTASTPQRITGAAGVQLPVGTHLHMLQLAIR